MRERSERVCSREDFCRHAWVYAHLEMRCEAEAFGSLGGVEVDAVEDGTVFESTTVTAMPVTP